MTSCDIAHFRWLFFVIYFHESCDASTSEYVIDDSSCEITSSYGVVSGEEQRHVFCRFQIQIFAEHDECVLDELIQIQWTLEAQLGIS